MFVNELVNLKYEAKSECIAASQNVINYWDINEVAEQVNNIINITIC